MTHEVAAQQTRARAMTGRSIRRSVTPQACMATHSLSPERRPKATSKPSRNAIGMVIASACGTRRTSIRRMIGASTPLASRSLATFSMGPIISMKVKTSSASRNGGRISRSV